MKEHWVFLYEEESQEQLANFGKWQERVRQVTAFSWFLLVEIDSDVSQKRKRRSREQEIHPDPLHREKMRNILITHAWYNWDLGIDRTHSGIS